MSPEMLILFFVGEPLASATDTIGGFINLSMVSVSMANSHTFWMTCKTKSKTYKVYIY